MTGYKYVLAAMLACAPFAANAVETVYTFDSVTGIQQTSSNVSITGILVNDTVPTTLAMPTMGLESWQERCARLFNVVLADPAAFTLTVVLNVTTEAVNPGGPFITVTYLTRCNADRKP